MMKLYNKFKEQINYLIFGVLTTVINVVVYYVCYLMLGFSNTISNILAWILSVLFAYVTNKLWVFESKGNNILKEMVSFFGCRLATGVLDIAIMFIFVDILNFNGVIMKLASNVIVIVANYIASKLIIFKK